MKRLALLVALCLATSPLQAGVILNEDEIAAALTHGPWPPEPTPDPSNRVSRLPEAIALGEALFFDPILSADGTMRCAACHDPAQGYGDGLPRGKGRALLLRNTPALWNLSQRRWFGWSGGSDNLWAQSLSPILHPDELAQQPSGLKASLAASSYAAAYADLFGAIAGQEPETVAVNTAKALAAYQETLVSGRTPFDEFRDALESGDMTRAAAYPLAAQRGLRIFLGEGRCAFCHLGPAFTNGEFHDAGVPYFLPEGGVDQGRFAGLTALLDSPYTLDGSYSDDPERRGAWAVRTVRRNPADFGMFRVPGLRNVSRTAPYMHNGSLPDLMSVARHYNDIDLERIHSDGEAILRPIGLTETELADLVAFLQSLDDTSSD